MSKNLNRNYMFKPCKGTNSEKGVALIMVLGLLTVMVLMAVTFAITMRTERLAAGNAADTVRARELVQVGLVRVMNDLAVNLGPTGLIHPDGKVYPDWNVTNSYYTNDITGKARWGTNVYLLATDRANEATNYIPRSIWTAVTNADTSNPSYHWLPVEHLAYTNNPLGNPCLSESNLMGRVAYLILNCSGLLDANYVGGTARGVGMDPTEIAISNMYDFSSGGAQQFFLKRTQDIRYETLEELYQRNLSQFNGCPSNFITYSHAPAGYWRHLPTVTNVWTNVNLAGSSGDLEQRQEDIINAFGVAGYTPLEAGILYTNLLDYVDMDCIPRDLRVSVEPVPMINEIVFSNQVTRTDNIGPPVTYTYVINNSIIFELWYPFALTNYQDFSLAVSATFGSGKEGSDTLAPANIVNQIQQPINVRPNSFTQLVFSSSITIPDRAVQLTGPITCTGTVTLASVRLFGTATDVDRLDTSPTVTNINNVAVAGQTVSTNSLECLDPRANWDALDYSKVGSQWYLTNLHSLGQVNGAITNAAYLNPSLTDGDLAMHYDVAELCSVDVANYHLIVSGHRLYRTGQAVTIGAVPAQSHVYYAIIDNPDHPEEIELARTYQDAMNGAKMLTFPSGVYCIKPTLQSVAELGCLRYSVDPWTTVKLYGTTLARETIKPFLLWPAIPFTADSVSETIRIINPYARRTTKFMNGMPITVSSSGTLPLPLMVQHTYHVANCISETEFQLRDPASGTIVNILDAGNGTNVLYPFRILPDSYSAGLINANVGSPLDVLSVLFQDIPAEPFPGTASEIFTVADTTFDTLRISGRRAYYTGSAVRLRSTVQLPDPLTDNRDYYVIQYQNTPDMIQLADSYLKATNHTPIDISSSGSGIHRIRSATLNKDQADNFAQQIVNGYPSTNISDVGKMLINYNNSVFGQETERESVLRSVVGLLNLRQNMFMVIIEAQTASGGNIPKNPAKQRAVAIVWRDPYTGEMFVRHIKWLGD